MGLFKNTRSKKSVSIVRIISAVLVLGVLVLIVAESARYLYIARVPKSVSSKIDPSMEKLASVLGMAKTSLDSLENIGNIFTKDDTSGATERVTEGKTSRKVVSKIAILSDSHNDLESLKKALEKAKNLEVEKIVFLGDYTDYGKETDLAKSKEIMDQAGIDYVSLPGDHDIAETRDESNFAKVFGKTYGVWEQDDLEFMYFDNSKNYTAISPKNIEWFKNNINSIDFLFLSQPLMTYDVSRVMGIIDDVKDEVVYAQNKELLDLVRNSKVRVIIAGDLHEFSHLVDPVKKDLQHYIIGAVVSQSLENRNIYPSRFAVLDIFSDDSYNIDDIPID
ncbi:MAG: metallophosphoesterase family protein [Patescibacteria group bacterium]